MQTVTFIAIWNIYKLINWLKLKKVETFNPFSRVILKWLIVMQHSKYEIYKSKITNAAHNSLKFEEIRNVFLFINGYAEEHAILLPGRVPGLLEDISDQISLQAPIICKWNAIINTQ